MEMEAWKVRTWKDVMRKVRDYREAGLTGRGDLKRAQAAIDGEDVAEMLLKFQRDFCHIYSEHVMERMFTAVGPMQTFLGHMINEGRLLPNHKTLKGE